MSPDEIKGTITAKGTKITVLSSVSNNADFISLTDIARYKNPQEPKSVVANWMRLRNTIEYLGLWEELHNPNFKGLEFDAFLRNAGANAFTLSPQRWIDATGAVGITSRSGRNGGTFAHSDIAFKFAAWISAEFELYVVKDYQRLKADETHRLDLDWNVKRLLSKANYRIHTDAIKERLIPPNLTRAQESFIYADEADVLNVALFGKTAALWRRENPSAKGNIRDHATIDQLLVLTNLENANALFIQQGMSQEDRLKALRNLAVSQLTALSSTKSAERLRDMQKQVQLPLPDKKRD